jgi:putative transcriptional regulator
MDTDRLKFNNRMRMWRAEQRLSQGELADLVGVSRQTISSIENLQFVPSARLALLICLALEKKFEEVFYFE